MASCYCERAEESGLALRKVDVGDGRRAQRMHAPLNGDLNSLLQFGKCATAWNSLRKAAHNPAGSAGARARAPWSLSVPVVSLSVGRSVSLQLLVQVDVSHLQRQLRHLGDLGVVEVKPPTTRGLPEGAGRMSIRTPTIPAAANQLHATPSPTNRTPAGEHFHTTPRANSHSMP